MASFEAAIEFTLQHEGAYSKHPHDKGGATLFGIASASWPDVYVEVMRLYREGKRDEALARAKEFYRQNFWNARPFSRIESQPVATLAFDMHVNHSMRAAGRLVQRAANALSHGQYSALTEDGIVGPKTVRRLNALARRYQQALIAALCSERYAYFKSLTKRDHRQRSFMRGWANRCYPPD